MYFKISFFFNTFVLLKTLFMHTKHCANCGNDNDPILTNCIFCKTALPIIDLNSIPNEVLVMNAAEWIGKLREGGYVAKYQTQNKWGIGGTRMVDKAEIQGNSLKYLSLLEIRASTNSLLINTVNNLREDYEKNTKKLSKRQKMFIGLIVFFVIWVLALVLPLYFLSNKH